MSRLDEKDALLEAYFDLFGDDLYRPRDESDVDVDPESLRGKALAIMDAAVAVRQEIEEATAALPWYERWPIRLLFALVGFHIRIRYWLRRAIRA